MPRTSSRNLLAAFTALQIDDRARGAQVSDDIQMVYVIDDATSLSESHVGTGGTEAAVVGEHGVMSLQCNNPGGLVVDTASAIQVPFFGNEASTRVWTSAVVPTITGPASPTFELLQGPSSQAIVQQGTIATANIPAGASRYLNQNGNAIEGFLLRDGFFFNMAFSVVNVATALGLRWRELSRS